MKWSVRLFWEIVSVLCLLWSLPGKGFTIKQLNTEKSKNVELLFFVLHNNQAWDFVLNQNIKITHENRPLYHDTTEDGIDPETKEKLRLIKNDEMVINPLPIIKRVLVEFGWLGSYIDYGVIVLYKAFMCTTYEFLKLQIEIIALMEGKYPTPVGQIWRNDPDKPLLKAWESVVLFIDKVTALHGDLEILTDLSHVYTEFMLENPGRAVHVLTLVAKEIGRTIDEKCDETNQKVILEEFGAIITPEYLHGDAIKYEEIKKVFNNVINGMIKMFGKLTIETISMQNWSQILDSKTPVVEHINLYSKIDKLLEADEIGRVILRERAARAEEKRRKRSENTDDDNVLVFEGSAEVPVDESHST